MGVDLVVQSRHVFDGTGYRTRPAAVAVKDGRIIAVDRPEAVEGLIGSGTEVRNYGNAFICAGFHDSHQHVFHSALFPSDLALEWCGNSELNIAWHMEQFAKDKPYGQWALSHGWRDMLWNPSLPPTRLSLDSVFPDRPCAMYSGDSHTLWLNTCALRRLGIDEDTEPPAGGSFDRDGNGHLTGVLREAAAMYYVAKVLEDLDPAAVRRVFSAWIRELNARGITSVDDMGLSAVPGADAIREDIYLDLEKRGELTVRAHLYPTLPLDGDLGRFEAMTAAMEGPMLRAQGLKQFFDGVSSAHTAWLLEPYANPFFPGDCGHPTMAAEAMRKLVLKAASRGHAVRIHTIGDRAVDEALSIFEEAQARYGAPKVGRHCLEHIENLRRADVARIRDAGVVASVQPQHVVIDTTQPDRDLGPERASFMWPFATYLGMHVPMAFGTDSPCVPMHPWEILHAAVTRQELGTGQPIGGWLREERIPMADALRALTQGSAYAVGREDELGSLTPGKWADMVVIDRNPLAIGPDQLLDAQVITTFVAGRPVAGK